MGLSWKKALVIKKSVNILKSFMESSQEIPVLESILIKMQVSNQKETPSQKFFCEFSKSCKNTCFIEHPALPNFNIAKVQLSIYCDLFTNLSTKTAYQGVRNVSFSGNFAYVLSGWTLTFQRVYQTQWFSIIGRWLPTEASLCTFFEKE